MFSILLMILLSSHFVRSENLTISTNETSTDQPEINQLSLAYGLLLETDCQVDDDCMIKNSICNSITKRCDCDFNAIHSNNRCHTLKCRTTEDCSTHFENTICVFGTCRCRWGLRANGKCVDLDVPVIGSQSLPDWAISLIAISALLSGILGARSPFISQLSRHLVSMLVIILGRFARNNSNNQNDNNNNQTNNDNNNTNNPRPSILMEDIQAAMIQLNDVKNDKQQSSIDEQQSKPLSSTNIIEELVTTLVQQQQQAQQQQQQQQPKPRLSLPVMNQ